MGRRARPVELLLLQGNKHLTKDEIRERRDAEAALRPPVDDIKCPTWLGKAGRREWKRVIKSLTDSKLMTNIDVASLAVYCDAVDKYAEASQKIKEQGEVVRQGVVRQVMDNGAIVETNAGKLIQNPYVLVATKYAGIIARFAGAFGLDPSARAGLAIPKDPKSTPKDKFKERFGS